MGHRCCLCLLVRRFSHAHHVSACDSRRIGVFATGHSVLCFCWRNHVARRASPPAWSSLPRPLVGHLKGGLAMVNIFSSMLFGGISGSAVADISALGSLLIPVMKERGYRPDFAVNVTVTSSIAGHRHSAQPQHDHFRRRCGWWHLGFQTVSCRRDPRHLDVFLPVLAIAAYVMSSQTQISRQNLSLVGAKSGRSAV